MDRHAFGHAVGGAADGAGDMGAVTVAVGGVAAAGDGIVTAAHAAAELAVGQQYAGVDDVGMHACSGSVVGVGGVEGQIALVDTVEAPGRAGLGGADRDDTVFFDIGHVRIGKQPGKPRVVGFDHEAAQCVLETFLHPDAMFAGHILRYGRHACGAATLASETGRAFFEDNDIVVCNRFFCGSQLGGERRQRRKNQGCANRCRQQ